MRISDGSSDVCSSDLFTPSGNSEIDKLLGGGLERGTNALFIGAAGVGKSSLALTFALAAAGRGEHAVFFAFDEGRGTLEARARTIGQPLDEALRSEEHTSELQSLMRISYAVFCLKKTNT